MTYLWAMSSCSDTSKYSIKYGPSKHFVGITDCAIAPCFTMCRDLFLTGTTHFLTNTLNSLCKRLSITYQ